MKKLLTFLLLLASLVTDVRGQEVAQYDVTARARNTTNTGYRDNWWPAAGVGSIAGLMGIDATPNRDAVTLALGTGFTRVGNVISVTPSGGSQVNSDWDAVSGVAQILHKPDLSIYATSSAVAAQLTNYVTSASMSTTLGGYVTNTALTSTLANYVNASSLSTTLAGYATTGAVTSGLAGKFNTPACPTSQYLRGDGSCATFPAIPAAQVQADWAQASSGAVDFIKNKPTIPAAQVQADWAQASTSAADFIKNKPTIPTVTPFNFGYGTTRALTLATAYQAVDPTKAAVVTVTLDCSINATLSLAADCSGEVRFGPLNTVATGASGTVVGTYKQSAGVSVLNALGQRSTITVNLPIGGYFAVRQTAGSGLSVSNALDQPIN